jgi:hypothetical protein
MSFRNLSVFALCGGILGGCTTPNQVATPSDVTLRSAVIELTDTLYLAQMRAAGRPKTGLIADSAVVEFNIAAKATNKANANAGGEGIPLGVGGTLGLSVANEAYSEGSRGNKITLTFKNIATADYSKGGAAIADRCLRTPQPPGCPPIIMNIPPL